METVSREILNEPGGKQDQYMAAYGGVNFMWMMAMCTPCIIGVMLDFTLIR